MNEELKDLLEIKKTLEEKIKELSETPEESKTLTFMKKYGHL